MLYIGIDPGVKTGLAIWDAKEKKFAVLEKCTIIQAMEIIRTHDASEVEIFIEDARQRYWFGNSGREKLQGAGSIKRDCGIWEDFCKFHNFKFTLVAPKNNTTKLDAFAFRKRTGYQGQTNEHSRDAGMLVFGR